MRRCVIAALQGLIADQLSTEGSDVVEATTALAFSRADSADYLALLELWLARGTKQLSSLPRRDCPACGSRSHRASFTSYDGYPFHTCVECGTLFVPLVVDEVSIEEFYREVPAARVIADRMMTNRDVVTRVADRERFSRYFELVRDLGSTPGRRSRYLDIGCGVGHSVELAQEFGYEAVGLEVNQTAIETARASGRPVFHPANWSGKGRFQLVSMFETLEHVTRPATVLTEMRARLAKGGIAIITVPNGSGLEAQLLRERCFHVFGGFEGVGHINLFTPEGLRRLFANHGLTAIHFDGEFSNNTIEIAGKLSDPKLDVLASLKADANSVRMPRAVLDWLNAIAPELAALERASLRSPILVVVACRQEDADQFTAKASALSTRRRHAIEQTLQPSVQDEQPQTIVHSVGRALFDPAATSQPIPDFLLPSLVRHFAAPALVESVTPGLSLRSAAPLAFERMAEIGAGRLAAGNYELAAHARLRAGRVSFSLLDEASGTWATSVGLEPDDDGVRVTFALAADTDCTLYVCAHNSDAPAPVEVDIYDAGIAACSATARLIPPPPVMPPPDPRLVVRPVVRPVVAPPTAGATSGARLIDGFLGADVARRLAAPGLVDTVAAGISIRSAVPLKFERMAELGRGTLAAGDYALMVHGLPRTGRVSFSLLDASEEAWITTGDLELEAGTLQLRFCLAAATACILYVCAHNSDEPSPIDIDIFAIALSALSTTAALVVPPTMLFAAFADARPLDGLLLPAYAPLAAPDRIDGIVTGFTFRSTQPLRFEYMALLGRVTLAPGRYVLSALADVVRGHASISLLDTARGAWIGSASVSVDHPVGHVAFALEKETPCTLHLCANNSEGAAPLHLELRAVGLAALGDGGAIVTPPQPLPGVTPAPDDANRDRPATE